MPVVPTLRTRLASAPDPDMTDAVGGIVHDPLWFIARQWQVGELQGENATTPVLAHVDIVERPLAHPVADPRIVPAEAIIESESGDWWTIGRRIRIGRAVRDAGELPTSPSPRDELNEDDPIWWFRDAPPPYAAFTGEPDGWALWDPRWGVPRALFSAVPPDIESAWDASDLVYQQEAAFESDDAVLDVDRHRGGRVDWYSVDARARQAQLPPARTHKLLPTRMTFPGMPLSGIWEVEDADADIAAVPPDSAHTSTAIMQELYSGHHDEWFGVPVQARAGHIARITRVRVTDAFGNEFDSEADVSGSGLRPPSRADGSDWTLFRTAGLDRADLVLWNVAELPLQSDPIESVQFGIDEAANLLWAVERRIDHRDVQSPRKRETAGSILPNPPSDLDSSDSYVYIAGEGAAAHWIPYELDHADGATAQRLFVQRRLVDLSYSPPKEMPAAAASVLRAPAGVHRITAASIPSAGLELERRWQLARDTTGKPVLWIQRQRRPLLSAPARELLFDVAEPIDPPPPE